MYETYIASNVTYSSVLTGLFCECLRIYSSINATAYIPRLQSFGTCADTFFFLLSRLAGLRMSASMSRTRELFGLGKPAAKTQAFRHKAPIKGNLYSNFAFFLSFFLTAKFCNCFRSHFDSARVEPPTKQVKHIHNEYFLLHLTKRKHHSFWLIASY